MKLLRDTDPRFQFLGWRVVLFMSAIFIALAVLGVGVALKQGMFVKKMPLIFFAEHGAGLNAGMQVRFSGFRIGVVDKVTLDEQARVNVQLKVEARYMKWIKADTTAQMQQDGLMGDYYLEMVGGSAKLPPLTAGGQVKFAPIGKGIAGVAEDIKDRAFPIIDSVQETLNYINDPKGDVRQIVANVRQLTTELQQTRSKVDQLLGRVDGLVNNEVRAAALNASQVLARSDAALAEVQTRLPLIMDRAASSVASVDAAARDASAMTAKLRATLDETAPKLPGLVRDTGNLVRDSNETLQGLQQSWPLNKMLTPVPLDAPVPDSRR